MIGKALTVITDIQRSWWQIIIDDLWWQDTATSWPARKHNLNDDLSKCQKYVRESQMRLDVE